MNEIIKRNEFNETKMPEKEGFSRIEPLGDLSTEVARSFIETIFSSMSDVSNPENYDVNESVISEIVNEYFTDLKNKAEYPDTIPNPPFEIRDIKKRTPEENALLREEFYEKKDQIKKQWEEINGRQWPKYENDVYSSNGKLIRKTGEDYDAHHDLPLCLGGKNEAVNITPVHAENHYDKQGLHSPDSPYEKLSRAVGGNEQ